MLSCRGLPTAGLSCWILPSLPALLSCPQSLCHLGGLASSLRSLVGTVEQDPACLRHPLPPQGWSLEA